MTENVNLSWNSSLNNKSWVELIEEEEQEELNNRSKDKSNVSTVSFEGLISKRSSSSSSFFGANDVVNKSSPTVAKSGSKVSPVRKNDNDKKDVWSSIRNDKFEIINEESVNSCSNTRDTNEDSSRDDLFDFAITNKFEGKTGTTTTKVIDKEKNRRSVRSDSLSKGLKIERFDAKSNGTNEELSLTGHLDIFHVDSPSKVATINHHKFSEHVLDITCEDTMFSPIKLSGTSAVTPVKDALAATRKRSNTFSSSPSKRLCRSTSKLIAETQSSPVTNFSQGLRDANSGTKNNDHSSPQSENCDDFRKPYDTRRQSRIQRKDNPPISRRTRSRSKLSETDSECSSPTYKRSKRYSSTSSVDSLSTNASTTDSVRYETNSEVLTRRQKQIDYGKNTLGYERYTQLIPKDKRGTGDPKTPPKNLKYSRRAWDGLIKSWRLRLHKYDPESNQEALDCLASNDDAAVSDE